MHKNGSVDRRKKCNRGTKLTNALRVDLVKAGFGPPEALKAVDAGVLSSHNVFGEQQRKGGVG